MIKSVSTGAVIVSALLMQTSAQLLGCSQVQCPMNNILSNCRVEGTTFPLLGIANFSSSLSSNNLTWTVGYFGGATVNDTEHKRYFLGTPHDLNLNARTDFTGCALFFTGIEHSLQFPPDGTGINEGSLSGTCAGVLGGTCVSDLTSQAHNLAANLTSSGSLQCSDIAQALMSSPPVTCLSEGTWGNVTAKTITGPDSPAVLQLDNCNPTGQTSYDARDVATFANNHDSLYIYKVTPLITIFAPTGNGSSVLSSPEVNLQCMKPIEDDTLPGQATAKSLGEKLVVKRSWPAMLLALTGFVATASFVI